MLEYLEQQKKLTINQWKIFAAVTIGDMLDFFDFLLIAFVLAFIVKDWQLTYGQSAVILVSAGLGAVPGAFFWGWMGDRIGRRKVFILTALNVALALAVPANEAGGRSSAGRNRRPRPRTRRGGPRPARSGSR